MSPSKAVAATITTVAVLLVSAWIPYAKYRWHQSLQRFIEQHGIETDNDNDDAPKRDRDILLIVNPASGGGKSMHLYDTVLSKLQATGRALHVIVTKSSEHLQSLTRTLNNDITSYKAIAIMGGDSTITEFVHHELVKNKGKWRLAPILHIPAGTGNAIAREMFASASSLLPSVSEIIRHGLTQSRNASVLQITSPSMDQPCYVLHNAFDGAQRRMLENLDASRDHLYPAFGSMVVMPIVFWTIFFGMKPNNMPIPYILAILTDTEGGDGNDLGFGIDRFDNQMMVLHMPTWRGSWQFFRVFLTCLSGEFATDFGNGKPNN